MRAPLLRVPLAGLGDAALALPAGETHIWQADLEAFAGWRDHLAGFLAPAEMSRAERFHFDRDRRRYILGRAILRLLLGCYTGVDPRRIAFQPVAQGKPSLPAAIGGEPRFNMSESNGFALFAFARGQEVGIDVEHRRDLPDAAKIAAGFFSPDERTAFAAIPEPVQQTAFFAAWTRKEAYLKATGSGLLRPIDEFTVTFAPGEPARLVADAADPAAADRWTLLDLVTHPEYAAALCIEGPPGRLVIRQIDP